MQITKTLAVAVGAAIALPAAASAAPILSNVTGEAFDAQGTIIGTVDEALALATGEADATFDVTSLDYSNDGDAANPSSTLLSDFLGDDGDSLMGANFSIEQSVLIITGQILLADGDQTFTVTSDDGFRLTIGDMLVSEFNGSRGFEPTTVVADPGVGLVTFTLVYYDDRGDAGLRFLVDGSVATAIVGDAVPLPGALALMLPVLGAGAALRRRRA